MVVLEHYRRDGNNKAGLFRFFARKLFFIFFFFCFCHFLLDFICYCLHSFQYAIAALYIVGFFAPFMFRKSCCCRSPPNL